MALLLGKILASFESSEFCYDSIIGNGLTSDPIKGVGSFCVDLEISLALTCSAMCSSCFEVNVDHIPVSSCSSACSFDSIAKTSFGCPLVFDCSGRLSV